MDDGGPTQVDETVLRALLDTERRGAVPTVHAAAQLADVDYSTALAALNRLFAAGLIAASLHVTDAGRATANAGTPA